MTNPADPAVFTAVSPGRPSWSLAPGGLALLTIALAGMPLIERLQAYTWCSAISIWALAVWCGWRVTHAGRLAAVCDPLKPGNVARPGHAEPLSRLLRGILPVWHQHVESARTQIEEAVTELVVNFSSITDEFEDAGFKGSAGTQSQSDEPAALLTLCERDLQQVIAVMSDITSSKGDMTASMQELSLAAKELQSMAQGVAQIAAQTNLLAINAAIEAAHAGDSGRGFAAVAKEIRHLSQSSARTASQITERIGRVTAIMAGTMQAAAQAACQEAVAIDRSSGVVAQVLNHMRELSCESKAMRNRGVELRARIEQLIVGLQFQDRVSQLISVVDGDIVRLRDQVEIEEPAPAVDQWLLELKARYTMREQRQSQVPMESGGSLAPAPSTAKLVFF